MENDLLYTNRFIQKYEKPTYRSKINTKFKSYMEKKYKDKQLANNLIRPNYEMKQLNNIEKKTEYLESFKRYTIEKKILLNIDSSKRDTTLYPSANNYKISIVPPIKNISKIELVSSEFPNTEQLIRDSSSNSQNNLIQFRLLKDFQFGIGDKIYKTELKPGNYNSITLSDELNFKMNNLKKYYDDENFEFSISLDDVSDNVSISLIKSEFSKLRTIDGNEYYDENVISTNTQSKDVNFNFVSSGLTYFDHDIEKGDKFYILGCNPIGFLPSQLLNGQHYVKSVPNQSIFKFELPFDNKTGIGGAGGDLLKFGQDEYFQLLFNNPTSPYDILGFSQQDTNFKETHSNLIRYGDIYNIITGYFLDSITYNVDMIEFETFEMHDFSVGDQIYIDDHLKVYDELTEVNYIIPSTTYGYGFQGDINNYNLSNGISGMSSGVLDGITIGLNEFIITNVTNSNLYKFCYYDNLSDAVTYIGNDLYKGVTKARNGFDGSAEQLNINYSLIQLTQDTSTNLNSLYRTSRQHNLSTGDKIIVTNVSQVNSIDISNDLFITPTIINTTSIDLGSTGYHNYYIAKAYSFDGQTISGTTHTFTLTLDRIHNFYENDALYIRLDTSSHNLQNTYCKVSKSYYNSQNISIIPMNDSENSGTFGNGYLIENNITKYDIICSTLYKPNKTIQTSLDSGNTFYLRFFTYINHDLIIDGSNSIYIKNHRLARKVNGINQANGHTIIEVPSTTKFRIQYPHSFIDELQPLTSVTYTKYGTVSKKKVNNLIDLSGDDYILVQSPKLTLFTKNNNDTIDDIFAKILLVGEPGTFLFNSYRSTPKIYNENELPELKEIEFIFKRPDGTLFEFLNRDHSFTLEITTLIEKIGNVDYSTKVGRYDYHNPNINQYSTSRDNNYHMQ